MLTLSKVVVEVGNRVDAARAGDYRLEPQAAPEAFARTRYQLAEDGLGAHLREGFLVVVARRGRRFGAVRRAAG